jgi:translocation and assembly module TamA
LCSNPAGRRLTAAAVVLLGAAPTVRAADPQPYTTTITATADGALDAALAASSQLVALRQSAPVSAFALVIRARLDLDRLTTTLESFGYYQSEVAVTINDHALDDPGLPDLLAALPEGESATVSVRVTPGPLYHIGRIAIDAELSAAERAALALEPGMPANAAAVLDAQVRLLQALREAGYPFAHVDAPVADEDAAAFLLDLSMHVERGARAPLGTITIVGLKRVAEALVRQRLLLRSGDPFSPAALEKARRDLLALGVFTSVTARTADEPDADGRVSLTILVQERLRHSLGFNATYSSDLGASAGVRWSDRDLFGGAEQLNLAASAVELGGHATTGIGYNVSAQFIKPDFGARDESLQVNLATLRQSLQAYDQSAVTASTLVSHRYSAGLTGSVGLSGEREQITQQRQIYDYTLLALPVSAKYNNTGVVNPLEETLHGVRASASLTPTRAFGSVGSTFWVAQVDAAGFADLSALWTDRPGRTILAGRALIGQVRGAAPFDLPPDQRFYAGGSGTVRGFRYQSVGPSFADGTPQGGSAIDAATLELRERIAEHYGVVTFIDAGAVSADGHVFEGRPSVGAGIGVRYYTPIGPVRLDVAVPVVRLSGGDAFELYVGLGQAF